MSYDIRCLDLAEHFLPTMATDRLKTRLAQVIQDAIEDWMESEAARLRSSLDIAGPKGPTKQ